MRVEELVQAEMAEMATSALVVGPVEPQATPEQQARQVAVGVAVDREQPTAAMAVQAQSSTPATVRVVAAEVQAMITEVLPVRVDSMAAVDREQVEAARF